MIKIVLHDEEDLDLLVQFIVLVSDGMGDVLVDDIVPHIRVGRSH